MTVPTRLAAWFEGTRAKAANIEGSKLTPDGFLLGMRSGPKSKCIPSLLHEMAHLIEIEGHRAFDSGFGLDVREVEIMGQLYPQPLTAQATLREHRVVAIQSLLADHLEDTESLDMTFWAKLWTFMPDWCPAMAHFGLTSDQCDLEYDAQQKAMTEACEMNIQAERVRLLNDGGIEPLWREWRRKCAMIPFPSAPA